MAKQPWWRRRGARSGRTTARRASIALLAPNIDCGDRKVLGAVVLDAAVWHDRLPGIIEAVVFNSQAEPSQQSWARRAHAAFIAAYRLSDEDVPLLQLNLERDLDDRHLASGSGGVFELAQL